MIVYNRFWDTLNSKNISQYALITEYHISTGLLDRMRKNKNISMVTLNTLCTILDCKVEDIIEYRKDK